MNRRTFLKLSSGTLAAAGISNILHAQGSEEVPVKVFYFDTVNQLNYTLTYYATGVTQWSTAEAKKKIVALEISKKDASGQNISGKYEFEIASSVQDPKMANLYDLKGRSLKLVSGSDTLPKDFPKSLTLLVNQTTNASSNYFRFLHENGSIYLEFKPAVSNDSYEDDFYGCFLTSACVGHRGLPDNCYELQTLRAFRDDYMRTLPEGNAMVERYYHIGPKVVASINRHTEAGVIYEHIYQTLIIPALSLIEAGKPSEAMSYYHDYVLEMERQLSLN